MKCLDFLDDAAALEDALAESYGLLAGLTADPGVSEKLNRLRREEENHARIIRTGKNYVRRAPDLFGEAIISGAELQAGLASCREVTADIRSAWLPFREGLVRLAGLEDQFEKIHLDSALEVKDENLGRLFRRMARDDREHRVVLEEILQRPV